MAIILSPKIKRHIFRIIPFGVIWLIFGIVYILLEKGLLGDLDYYPSTGNPYGFGGVTLVDLVVITVTGLAVGSFEILYLNSLFSKKSFSKKILCKSLIYVAIIATFLLVLTVIGNSLELHTTVFNQQVWRNAFTFLTSFAFLSEVVYATATIGVSLFFSEVRENLGLPVVYNFLTGRYHKPIEEERIFMFLDMKSSTSIAERLGHVKYFEMLKEYYADFTDSIYCA